MQGKKFEKNLIMHKRLIPVFQEKTIDENNKAYFKFRILGEHLALAFYDFKCAICKSEKELQLHHIITHEYKKFMPLDIYCVQRHYWANIVSLCKDCHAKLHNFKNEVNVKSLSQSKIDKIRKEYDG